MEDFNDNGRWTIVSASRLDGVMELAFVVQVDLGIVSTFVVVVLVECTVVFLGDLRICDLWMCCFLLKWGGGRFI